VSLFVDKGKLESYATLSVGGPHCDGDPRESSVTYDRLRRLEGAVAGGSVSIRLISTSI